MQDIALPALDRDVLRAERNLAGKPHRSIRIPNNKRREDMKRRQFNKALAATAALAAVPYVRAQAQKLRVGVLLPRSGVQAGIGQDCRRGVEVATKVLADMGLPALDIMNGDTESNVDVARARAERLISEGAQLLVGAFDSGQTTAIAQVAEQKGIPFVINIAAAPPITEQGYKFVFRNFPTAPMILGDAFANQLEVFSSVGAAPKSESTSRKWSSWCARGSARRSSCRASSPDS